ncbi:MAG: beta strand repeat-containing protein, partial [Planctomycetota bacterium]
ARATVANGQITGITVLGGGSGYYQSPRPQVVIAPAASIQVDAMITSTNPGSGVGYGDGRGRVLLYADKGSVVTSGEVFFPFDMRQGVPKGARTIGWLDGDFRYQSTVAIDDLLDAGDYPGISVGTGAEFTAVLDGDGRVIGFNPVMNADGTERRGSGYSVDLPPSVDIEGLATAVAIVAGDGTIEGLRITYPGEGYGQAPRVTIRPNGFGRIVDFDVTQPALAADGTPLNRVHIQAAGGRLVTVAGIQIGDPSKPLKSDVETFVAETLQAGGSISLLEKDGLRIGRDELVDGIITRGGDVAITTFGGALELGAPVQRVDGQGRLLWQDDAKTIPIYERDANGDIVYEGGQIRVGDASVKLTADDIEVKVPLNKGPLASTGREIILQPVKVDAEVGLAGARARVQGKLVAGGLGALADGRLDVAPGSFWGGRGYSGPDAPTVVVAPPGERAFGTATARSGAVQFVEVVFGGTNYTTAPVVTLIGGGIDGATPANPAVVEAVVGDDGSIIGFTVTSGGSGYVTAPRVDVALPGQQARLVAILDTANPDPVSGRFAVSHFQVLQAGSNYTVNPRIEVAAPYDFTLDADEIAQFNDSFETVTIGRIEGQHLFHSPEGSFRDGLVLRAPRAGGTIDMNSLVSTGSVSIVGSGNTFHFDSAAATVSGTSISIDDNVIVPAGVSGTATATTGSIVVFGTGKGMIDGDPNGDDVGDDEDLLLAAHTNVLVTGAIGSRWKLDDLTVTSATRDAVVFEQSVGLTGDLAITAGTVTIGGIVDVAGDLVIVATGMVAFGSGVTVGGDLVIRNATGVTFGGTFAVGGTITLVGVTGTTRFSGLVTAADDLAITSTTAVEFLGGLAAAGDVTLTANEVEFRGGMASVVGSATGTLVVQPHTASRPIRVGTPTGSTSGTLDISDTDLAAIAPGWARVVIGDAASGTGAVTIGSIGTQQGSGNSWLANATTIVGGTVTVAQKVDVAATAAYLQLVARTGDVTVNAAINETAAERNAWLRLEAARAVAINAPIWSTDTVSLVSGTTITQSAYAPIHSKGMRVSASGGATAVSSGNSFDTLAVETSNAPISIREDSGYEIGTVDGVSGITVGTATATLESQGTVTQTQPINAGVLDLQGKAGNWVLNGANTVGTLTGNTGRIAFTESGAITLGALTLSAASGTALAVTAPGGITLGGDITTAGGDARFEHAVTLAADIAIDVAEGAAVGTARFLSTIEGTVHGQQGLALAGNLAADGSIGAVTALENLAVSGAAALAAGVSVRTTGDQTYSGAVTSPGEVTVRAGTGATVRFLGDVSLGGLVAAPTYKSAYHIALTGSAVSITDPVAFGNLGSVTLGDQATDDLHFVGGVSTATASGTNLAGTIRTTDAAATFGRTSPNAGVMLTADTTVSTGAGAALFAGTVDGAARLVVNAAGDTTFAAAVGGTTPLAHVETDAAGRTLVNGGAVTTGSPTSQVYNDPVLLGANTVFTAQAAGAITFASTLDGAFSATVNTQGITTFGGAVGGQAALASLVTDAGGTTRINGGSVTTTGSQTYNDAATLGAATTLSGSAITFATTLDGAFALAANSQGPTTFGGAVGGQAALASLVTDASGTTAINGGSVATTGSQTYNDAATLGAATTLSGGAITFATTLDGAFALAANSQGLTTFDGAVGGTAALASLVTDAGGTTRINGGSVTTTGSQTYNDAVALGAATTLSGSALTFATTLDGAFALAANSQGTTTFGGAVGGQTALASLVTDAGGTTQFDGGSVTTTGSQTYNDAATLGADTTLSGGALTFATTLDGAFALAANSQGTTTFGGAVGGTTPLVSLATDAGGTTALNGGDVTTTGGDGQVFGDAVILGALAQLHAGSGAISFASTVDGAARLVANTAGTTTFGGAVGSTTALLSLATDAGGTTVINGGSVTTTGNAGQVYGDAVVLGADTTFAAGTRAIGFASTLDGGYGAWLRTSGTTTFGGAVGSATPLARLYVNAGGTTRINGGSVTT